MGEQRGVPARARLAALLRRRRDALVADRWVAAWSLLLALLLLGPSLAPGYVLSYDMVWVPDLSLRPDFLGVGSALPRAVPSDAVVSVLDEVLPGWMLQKVVLLGAVVGGGWGTATLLRGAPLVARLVAVGVYQWSPFLAERLVLGHWPVLLGYAVLPWIVLLTARWREEGRLPLALGPLLLVGSLSATTGIATGFAVLVGVAGRRTTRNVQALALVAAANAPWLVSGLLHAASGTSDPAGARVFALAGEGTQPAPLTALTLGGVWNAEVVPASRDTFLVWVGLAFVLVLGALGVREARRLLPGRTLLTLVLLWTAGLLLALWSWALPDTVAVIAEHVPGGGLLRDGSRLLALCAPLLACLVGLGAGRVAAVEGLAEARGMVAGGLVLLPLLLMPDAAWGAGGRLAAVDYPDSYAEARALLVSEASPRGDVLLLPLSSYRRPSWNGERKVLDPTGRYLPRDFVTSDELVVSQRALAGEDPRVAAVAGALAADDPAERAAGLVDEGIGVVAIDTDHPVDVPEVEGEVLLDSPELTLVGLAGADPPVPSRGWVVAMVLAWVAFLLVPVGASGARALGALGRRVRRGEHGPELR
ncbi:hypothetical protein [Nocardioides sambongensis]|uniref:hypothetical protein n=1 Tax=Nocardioides sambongensis TaxID=2589074 RepID=UPI001127E9CF|nr:hypothetical protein [Nocardioides sambongensis]